MNAVSSITPSAHHPALFFTQEGIFKSLSVFSKIFKEWIMSWTSISIKSVMSDLKNELILQILSLVKISVIIEILSNVFSEQTGYEISSE